MTIYLEIFGWGKGTGGVQQFMKLEMRIIVALGLSRSPPLLSHASIYLSVYLFLYLHLAYARMLLRKLNHNSLLAKWIAAAAAAAERRRVALLELLEDGVAWNTYTCT